MKSNITILDQILDKKQGKKKDTPNANNGSNNLKRLDLALCLKKHALNWA